ncbi:ubiquitin-like-conjugating enzyme ATG10 isoform X4 [Salvia splendens]|uniref:ubiquitin-like-conjugating enzyme ATG10 isoform X4 n=1 Tax=Salvia splendens TaxID=180675 RepID=UPI001C26A63D|nr:ubiquitin-like-conjugating enzyme ATG10 isoform X4 [Salvia splendens]
MVESWDGTLSFTEFFVAASTFSEQWRKLNSNLPQWTWIPSPKRPWVPPNDEAGYLALENMILPRLSEGNTHHASDVAETEECCSDHGDEVVDTAVVVLNDGSGEHRYDLHVVYSASYRVPVLYFRAYRNDGQPLLLDVIENDISIDSAKLLTRAKWTFVTQEEHPELGRPWYMLHPCGTSEWMKLLLSSDVSAAQNRIPREKYMLSWFSVVGQVFGIKLHLQMLSLVDS